MKSKNRNKRKKRLASNKKIIERNKKQRISRSKLEDIHAWKNTHPSIWDKKEDPIWEAQARSRNSDFIGDNSLGSERTHYNKKRFIEQKKLEKKQLEIDIKVANLPQNKYRPAWKKK